MSRINLLDLDPTALCQWVQNQGGKPFRARQLQRWIYQQGVDRFDAMSDLAVKFRAQLAEFAVIQAPSVLSEEFSTDGTYKWLFDMGKGNAIETVFIPENTRGTLCVSSQVGCAVNCCFCSTGHQGFSRNLQASEIIGQLWWANKVVNTEPLTARLGVSNNRAITNVVMMGMGEPLLNYDQVLIALRLMVDDHSYGLSRRRVTVSTSGVVPMMDRLANDCPVALAVSLHAANDALRDQLVPLNRKYPLAELLSACNRYLQSAPRDFITFEYAMLDGINDTDDHADELIQVAEKVRCKINLIPFNAFPKSGLKRSSSSRIQAFAQRLKDEKIVVTVRKTRGDDINAACGQLAGEVQDRTRIKNRLSYPSRSIIPIVPAYA